MDLLRKSKHNFYPRYRWEYGRAYVVRVKRPNGDIEKRTYLSSKQIRKKIIYVKLKSKCWGCGGVLKKHTHRYDIWEKEGHKIDRFHKKLICRLCMNRFRYARGKVYDDTKDLINPNLETDGILLARPDHYWDSVSTLGDIYFALLALEATLKKEFKTICES